MLECWMLDDTRLFLVFTVLLLYGPGRFLLCVLYYMYLTLHVVQTYTRSLRLSGLVLIYMRD